MIASIGETYSTAPSYSANEGRSASGFTRILAGVATPSASSGDQVYNSAAVTATSVSPGRTASQVDFTGMTRQDMRDWVNGQITSGKMSFDDSTPFVSMTLHAPVGGAAMDDASLTTEKVNFIDLAQQGVAGAQSRGDQQECATLQKALKTMGADQASKIGDSAATDSISHLKEALAAFKKEASLTPSQRARRDVLKTMNLTEDAIKAMPPEQQKATEQKIAAEVARRLCLGENGATRNATAGTNAAALNPLTLSL